MINYIIGNNKLDKKNFKSVDLNGDGEINILDILLLVKLII